MRSAGHGVTKTDLAQEEGAKALIRGFRIHILQVVGVDDIV
jgi:hypothetical protein